MLFKSVHYPGELCATRRGSPMVIGVKCDDQLATNHVPVMFSKGKYQMLIFHFPEKIKFDFEQI